MPVIDSFDSGQLEGICRVLGHTENGLTGSEIEQLLRVNLIPDPQPNLTKWKRLFEAFLASQQRERCGNCVVKFIQAACSPSRYAGQIDKFDARRTELNFVLALCGYELGHDGRLRVVNKASTLSEASRRAGRLREELLKRIVHPDVLRFCSAELLQDNYFHAVLEATKSVADKIRQKSGLQGDGGQLAQEAFGLGKLGMPFLAFNTLRTKTEQDEQAGLTNLMVGMFGAFRNTTGHAPKVSWPVGEQDALDLLTLASFLHRRLDNAVRTPRQP
jgi:uncharacterized protein (TIGR02391 family)